MKKKDDSALKRISMLDIGVFSGLVLISCIFVIAVSHAILYLLYGPVQDKDAGESVKDTEPAIEEHGTNRVKKNSELVIEEQGMNFIRVRDIDTDSEVMLVHRGGGKFELIHIR